MKKHPNYELRLNIKSVMLYEQLTRQSFMLFQDNLMENSLPLIYCMLVANNRNYKMTYDEAVKYMFTDESLLSEMMGRLQKEMEFCNQFEGYNFLFGEDYEDTDAKDTKTKDNTKRPLFFSELVPALVAECGLSIEYVLYDMPLNNDILYMHYRDELRKTEMETKRLFTYQTIAPHINTKKFPYSKFMPFDWEKKRRVKNAKEYINNKANTDKLKEFLKSAPLEKPLVSEE